MSSDQITSTATDTGKRKQQEQSGSTRRRAIAELERGKASRYVPVERRGGDGQHPHPDRNQAANNNRRKRSCDQGEEDGPDGLRPFPRPRQPALGFNSKGGWAHLSVSAGARTSGGTPAVRWPLTDGRSDRGGGRSNGRPARRRPVFRYFLPRSGFENAAAVVHALRDQPVAATWGRVEVAPGWSATQRQLLGCVVRR